MKYLAKAFAVIMAITFSLASCSDDDGQDVSDYAKQTIIVYMPWSGSQSTSGLYSYLLANIDSMEAGIKAKKGLGDTRLMIYLAHSSSRAELFEVTYDKGICSRNTIKEYPTTEGATAQSITTILNDVRHHAASLNYALVIGSHGSGWTFKEDWENYPYNAKVMKTEHSGTPKADYPTTRFFGSVDDMSLAINVTTLAQAIADAGMKMQYILFDNCYMANVETAYELKDVTNFVVASTSEIMSVGMPYTSMWSSMATPTPSYSGMVSAFNSFYSNFRYPYGSLSAIDCRKLEELAAVMREVNATCTMADSLRDSIQILDGFNEPLFYDMADYTDRLCGDNDILKAKVRKQITAAIKSCKSTSKLYSYLYVYQSPKYIDVNTFSGLTISDPSVNRVAVKGREKTRWYKDTH